MSSFAIGSGAVCAADDGEWHFPAGDYASTRFSKLAQITDQNVGQLRLSFTFSTGVLRGHEAAPIVATASCTS